MEVVDITGINKPYCLTLSAGKEPDSCLLKPGFLPANALPFCYSPSPLPTVFIDWEVGLGFWFTLLIQSLSKNHLIEYFYINFANFGSFFHRKILFNFYLRIIHLWFIWSLAASSTNFDCASNFFSLSTSEHENLFNFQKGWSFFTFSWFGTVGMALSYTGEDGL